MDKNEFDNLEEILGEYSGEAPAEEELLPAEEPEAPEAAPCEESCDELCEELCEEPCEEPIVPERRRRRRWPWVLLAVVLLLAALGGAAYYAYRQATELMDVADAALDEVELAVDQVKDRDFAAVERSVASIDAKLDVIDSTLDEPLWKLAAKVPGPGDDLTELRALFGIWDQARDEVVAPALHTLQEYPLPDLENPDFKALLKNSAMLEAYIDLALTVIPPCERCMDDFYAIPTLSIPQLEEKMQEARDLIDTVRPFLPLATDMLSSAAKPAVETLKAAPLENLKLDERVINSGLILQYLDLAEKLVPLAEDYVAQLEELAQLPSEELNTLMLEVGGKAEELIALYHKGEKYIPLLKELLINEEERHYLVAIQNSTEIRSAGGFPGTTCVLYVGDGEVIVSPFRAVYDILVSNADFRKIGVTPTEEALFFTYLYQPRDAVITPHFPRVAEIWCKSTKSKIRPAPDRHGAISISPTLVQDFLAITGESIELSNGKVLDGTNATRYLQHEIYFDYFKMEERNVYVANDLTDRLFAEAAKEVLDKAFDAIKLDNISALIDMVDKHIANRTIMMWMEEPEAQALIEELGADGGLNDDPEKPEVGVYFNGCTSSKLGWYVNIDTEIGEGRKDGDVMTYPVTVTLEHTLPMEEFMDASAWLVGHGMDLANMKPCIYIFAPAGGTVSNFTSSNNMPLYPAEYQGLNLGYHIWAYFPLGEKIVITCDVTTAPGVETPPTFSKTPTLQEYR